MSSCWLIISAPYWRERTGFAVVFRKVIIVIMLCARDNTFITHTVCNIFFIENKQKMFAECNYSCCSEPASFEGESRLQSQTFWRNKHPESTRLQQQSAEVTAMSVPESQVSADFTDWPVCKQTDTLTLCVSLLAILQLTCSEVIWLLRVMTKDFLPH